MKKEITLLLFCLIFSSFCQSQIRFPYLEDFEDEDLPNIYMDIASPNYPEGSVWNSDPALNITQEMIITDGKNYSWDVNSDFQSLGKSLKLTVHANDHPHNAKCSRSRSEIAINVRNKNNKEYFYKWRFLIPDNNEFIDQNPVKDTISCNIQEDSGQNENPYHTIFQIANNTWEDGIKLNVDEHIIAFMEYRHNETLSNDKKRDLFLRLKSIQDGSFTRINIKDAIKKGVWNEFIFRIYWSDNNDAEFQIWINRKAIVIDPLATTQWDYFANLLSENDTPTIFNSSNIALTNDTQQPVTNSLKMGSYRRHHKLNHSVYIDDFQITAEFPPEYNKTKLTESNCGITLFATDMSIECYEIANATSYIFEFENNGNKQYVGNGNSTILDLNNVDFLQPGITYNVKVRSQGDNFSFDYGESCQVTIASKTKLLSEYCDSDISIKEMTIQCHEILDATSYIFEFEHNGIKQYVGNGNSTVLNLHNVDFLKPGITYNVKVRSQGNDFSFDYDESCQITIPHKTMILEQYCDTTIPINQMIIECYKIPNATSYIFEFESNGDKQYVGNGNSTVLNLNNVSFLNYETTYNVKARSQGNNFSFDYGNTCQITTPDIPLIFSKENTTKDKKIDFDQPDVFPNPFTANLNLNSNDLKIHSYQIYDIRGKFIAEGDIKSKILNLDFIPKGLYFLNLNTLEKSYGYKIIKN